MVPRLLVGLEDEAGHVLLLLDVHAGHRLVEEQEVGLGGQRPGELDPLLQAVGQLAHRCPADVLDLQEVDDLLDLPPVLDLLGESGPVADELPEEAAAHLEGAAGHDVVECRHALEEGDVLEGAGDARWRLRGRAACA